MEQLIDKAPMGRQGDAKDVILKLGCESFGDSLCSTPTLRKLAKSYGKKIIVCSHKPFVFENNPYVDYHIHINDFKEEFREQYEVLETFQTDKDWDFVYGNGTKMKYGAVDIRKMHCTNLGFDLKPNEMHCEYHPGPVTFEKSDQKFINNESYIVIHISQTWPSRTWAKSNYESLIKNINKSGYKVALIGYDTPAEALNNYSKACYNFSEFEFDGVSFLNRTSLDQDFEIIKKANVCVTCDTGILHLAGCTETEIIYIGGSIDPIFRAPYRHGGQDYRFSFVGGECKIFCGSDVKYCISEHGELNSLPKISECLEKKPTYECHPTHEQVFEKIAKVNLRNFKEYQEVSESKEGKKVFVEFDSSALGDTLAWIPYVEEYRVKNGFNVFCKTFHNELFEEAYPEINFIEPGGEYNADDVIKIGWYKKNQDSEVYIPPLEVRQGNLQETACFFLGLDYKEVKPKILIEDKEKKIKGKYVCIATQSTVQAKYWNNEEGWDKTVEYLQSLGYEVVCIDKNRSFGIEGQYNLIPEGVIDKTGDLPLQERITDLYNCDFFIGLPSGLSWLAWALDKEVVMISGFSDPKTEFYTPYRIINTQVCNSCFNKEEFTKEWNWCPYHEGTERQFECTKKITFEDVKESLDKVINFVDLRKVGMMDFTGLKKTLKLRGERRPESYLADEPCLGLMWDNIFLSPSIYEAFFPVEEGDVVLDIGAHWGTFSIYSMYIKKASKCYAIEPVPFYFDIMSEWMRASEYREVLFPVNNLISSKSQSIKISSLFNHEQKKIIHETDQEINSILNAKKTGEQIRSFNCKKTFNHIGDNFFYLNAIKLSNFFNNYPSEGFDFVKINCEGGEWSILNNEKELDLLLSKAKKMSVVLYLTINELRYPDVVLPPQDRFKTCNYSFDFIEKFERMGFEVRFSSREGDCITEQVLSNRNIPASLMLHAKKVN